MELLTRLESAPFVAWILEDLYAYPALLSFHALGLSLTVGVAFIQDLRLMGLYPTIPLVSLDRFTVLAWTGVWLNAITGVVIFTTQAAGYVTNIAFILKMLFVVLGTITLVLVQRTLRRDASSWDSAGRIPPLGRRLAISSLAFWTLAIVGGRVIAYMS